MTATTGMYYDGRVSHARPVQVFASGNMLNVEGDGISLSYPLHAVRLEPVLGDLPRRLDLPDGGSCLVEPAFELPHSSTDVPKRVEQWVNDVERHWPAAVLAAIVVIGLLWGGVVFGVPVIAKQVAMRTSPAVERQMGRQAVAALDRLTLQPSQLPTHRQMALAERFRALTRLVGADGEYTLLFRTSPSVGPNAFAIPGGTVVLLDELVEFAKHDDEIAAVLAHEIGHLHEKHTMRHMLQTSVAGVLVAAVVGDVLSMSSYAAALPALLLEARYSRQFESEADEFGLAVLDRAGIDRVHFVRLLSRLEAENGDGLPGFLSTHPRARDREQNARDTSRP